MQAPRYKETAVNPAHHKNATDGLIAPLAIGRPFLRGCSVSYFLSMMSLKRYIALVIMHQVINPAKSPKKFSRWNNCNEKNGAAKIKIFFTQCLGRRLTNINFILSIILIPQSPNPDFLIR